MRENVIKIVRGKLELHAGEVQTLYNGRTMDLVKFREKFDGRQTPAGDGRRKPRSMPRGRRQVRSVAGWSAEPRSKTGQTARGPPRPGTEGKSPGETGDCRRRRRTAKAPVEAMQEPGDGTWFIFAKNRPKNSFCVIAAKPYLVAKVLGTNIDRLGLCYRAAVTPTRSVYNCVR